MNYRKNFRLLGFVLLIESFFLIFPIITALVFHEEFLPFLITLCITLVVGLALNATPVKTQTLQAKDGFFIVTFSWLVMALFGAIPFVLSSQGIPSYIDAFFETVSGFTTTGITILSDPSTLSKGCLFWRALTQWMGGMGVLVLMLAIVPLANDNSMHVVRAEMAGPSIDKIVPRTRDMAIWMYCIYIGLTVMELTCLMISGVPFFDALLHTFTTAATGGFSTHAESVAFFQNPATQWVFTVFMFLFGVNFNVFFLLILRKITKALKNEELWVYIGLVLASSFFIAFNVLSRYDNFSDSIRESTFQVVSVMTTTGFSVTDSGAWPVFIRMLLLFLMIFGACAGSTGGAVKLSRLIILIKYVISSFCQFAHPREVIAVKQDSKKLSNEVIRGTAVFVITYFLLIIIGAFFIAFEGYDFEYSLTVSISAIGDNGIGFGDVVSTGYVGGFSVFNKLFISFLMLAGRLEVFPVVVLLLPATYRRK